MAPIGRLEPTEPDRGDEAPQLVVLERKLGEHPGIEPVDIERLCVPGVGGEGGSEQEESQEGNAKPLENALH